MSYDYDVWLLPLALLRSSLALGLYGCFCLDCESVYWLEYAFDSTAIGKRVELCCGFATDCLVRLLLRTGAFYFELSAGVLENWEANTPSSPLKLNYVALRHLKASSS